MREREGRQELIKTSVEQRKLYNSCLFLWDFQRVKYELSFFNKKTASEMAIFHIYQYIKKQDSLIFVSTLSSTAQCVLFNNLNAYMNIL